MVRCGVVIVWALGLVLIAVVRGGYLSTSKRWGFKEEPFFPLWRPKDKGEAVRATRARSIDGLLGRVLGRRILGLVDYEPQGEPLQFRFPPEFTRRRSDFDGHWTLVKVGSGGYGTVYACYSLERRFALKVPLGFEAWVETLSKGLTLPELKIEEEVERAFANEVVCLYVLDHPHVLKLVAHHVDRRSCFLVYEYATHGSLKYQLEKGTLKAVNDVLVLAVQLADALRYLHAHGIVHGDVKPSNILFVDGVAKLSDFSTARKALELASGRGMSRGTPGWRAPEQVDEELESVAVKRGYQSKVDVYQLGNLLLYTLTGEKVDGEEVLRDESAVDRVLAKLKGSALAGLVKKMLRKEPWERPSLEVVINEFANLLNTIKT